MTPEEVIAEVIADEQADEHRYGNGCMYAPSVGEKAVAALRVAGYRMIQLPDAAGISEAHITYGHGDDCEFDCCPPWVRDEDLDYEYSVSEARLYAAALLAAAVAAEETR